MGISPSQLSSIFTPFNKVMENREFNREGVGLGLAVSKTIAQALGGDIIVDSVLNKGSSFTLTLPFENS